MEDIVSNMKMCTRKKAQRYRQWKTKATKLQALRQKNKEVLKKQNPSEGVVFGGFVPSGHGFNFVLPTTPSKSMIKEIEGDEMKDADEAEDNQRKRKNVDDETKKEEAQPWYTRYIMEKVELESSIQARFSR